MLIGEDIEVVVPEVMGNQVKLGIKAPKDIPVQRNELVEKGRNSLSMSA